MSGPIKYKNASNYKYQTIENWALQTAIKNAAARIENFIELDQDGVLKILAGYAWDGASGPTFDTKSSMRASLAHDALYQLERAGKLGEEWRWSCDQILHDLCVADGMYHWRASLWLWGVRTFAASSAARREDAVMVAP